MFQNKHLAGCTPLTPCKNCREVAEWRERLAAAPKRISAARKAALGRSSRSAEEGEEITRLGKNPRTLAVLKAAGYETYESLEGASRAELAELKFFGEPGVALLQKALKKRGINLSD